MHARALLMPLLILAALAGSHPALAQDKGSIDPKPLPPLAHPDDPKIPAKELFGRKLLPAACNAGRSASTPRAASPAPSSCRSTATPGR